ncbi:hypothetical protein ACFY1P_32800 [Streptomyces sp. NPDC001407]|uniref:hypothetical protein n=1 Tax=Streptomyces sp. NPDC001407 TaxID=3364573 RepID=UPI00368F2470
MPTSEATRARRGTIALYIASAVLAVVGVALLLGGTGGGHRSATGAVSGTAGPSSEGGRGPAAPKTTASAPVAGPSVSSAPAAPKPLPAPMQEAARAFTVAWASHDARPGHDSSYDEASRRAAAYAADQLADDLRTRTSGTSGRQQWLRWKKGQVQVTASVQRVALPDGAPAPTGDSGFARVHYQVTEQPATGPSVTSEQHVALKLRRGSDGTWRVVGLPNA